MKTKSRSKKPPPPLSQRTQVGEHEWSWDFNGRGWSVRIRTPDNRDTYEVPRWELYGISSRAYIETVQRGKRGIPITSDLIAAHIKENFVP